MSATHLHLILNHLPMLGVVFAGVLFAIALLYRNARFQRLSLWFLVLFALTAIPVYLTGESAEEVAERLPGVSEAVIERHEEAALAALVAMEVLGGLALLGAALFRKAARIPAYLAAGVLALTLSTTGLFAWTGYLGGQIRHTEIGPASAAASHALPEGRNGSETDDD